MSPIKVVMKCAVCNKELLVYRYLVEKKNKKYCSTRCHGLADRGRPGWQGTNFTKDPLFYLWVNMRQRCNNPNNKSYKNYGGRGITCDPRWNNFATFRDEMKPSYRKGLSLDRIDVNGNYSKENCRWATQKVQCNNKRTNKKVTFRGITKNLYEWADSLNIKRSTLSMRLNRYGWTIEEALNGRRVRI